MHEGPPRGRPVRFQFGSRCVDRANGWRAGRSKVTVAGRPGGLPLEFLHFLPVSGGDEAAEGGLQADRGEQIRLFRHFFAQ